jgi:tryptophan synthase alpha chain
MRRLGGLWLQSAGCGGCTMSLLSGGDLPRTLADAGVDMICLLSPTTSDERIDRAASLGSGFLYVISRLGVTGARATLAEGAAGLVSRIRRRSGLPVALGFGLSTPAHVREAGSFADAAVVGSALVRVIEASAASPDLPLRVERFVGWLKGSEPGQPGGREAGDH